MVECVELIRKVVERQETMEYLAMCGQGEWFLDNRYASKQLEETAFYRMTDDQKKRAFDKFYVLEPGKSNVLEQPSTSEIPALTSGYSELPLLQRTRTSCTFHFRSSKIFFLRLLKFLVAQNATFIVSVTRLCTWLASRPHRIPTKYSIRDIGSSPATALV